MPLTRRPPGQTVRGRSAQGWNSTSLEPFDSAKEIERPCGLAAVVEEDPFAQDSADLDQSPLRCLDAGPAPP